MKYIVLLALLGAVVMQDVAAGQANFPQQFFGQCVLGQTENPRNAGVPVATLAAYCRCVTLRVTDRLPSDMLDQPATTQDVEQQRLSMEYDAVLCHAAARLP